jgi:hypothetical protein
VQLTESDCQLVAEKSRVPLYIVSASDLGTAAAKVEKGLMNALECCQLWDAVLLIDEADVFLESRNSNNLERNELVSSRSQTFPVHFCLSSKWPKKTQIVLQSFSAGWSTTED